MATFKHMTSTDADPDHELCPPGEDSWCTHRSAEAKGGEPPKHKYNLPPHVATAMLPIFQRLSEPGLLKRCLGAKTQNAAESFHSTIWTILPKAQHASLFAVECGVAEAICRYNAGVVRSVTELSAGLSLKPGQLTLQRAKEKDVLRLQKAKRRHRLPQRSKCSSKSTDYSPGNF